MKSLKFLFVIALLVIGIAGCKYSFIVPEDIPIVDPNDPDAVQVSFTDDIQPIFNDDCVACHNGSRNPNLSAGNSYSAISSGYINTDNPEESLIYTKADPDGGGAHKKYSSADAALVLGWIKQGAKNN